MDVGDSDARDAPASPGDGPQDEPEGSSSSGGELEGLEALAPDVLSGGGLEGRPEGGVITVAAPPVVAVMVTRNPGPWLEAGLVGLRDQDYPDLTVLVLDAGSTEDPTSRVAAVLPHAFVRRIEGRTGFAAAANEALGLVEGATFLAICHDDVALDPDAVRLMVEEAYRSNAGVVGPKLVDPDDPRVLLEVGMAIDRFGAPHSDIEAGELDQEQHDAVRDVFYVSSAVMLVRFDLFAELGGFDPATSPGSEDLDLCWRARLAGARVLVVPDARARHRRAAGERGVDDAPSARELERTRLRAVLVGYSRLSLLYMVPWTILHTIVESVAFLVTGRLDRARAVWGAWAWNLRRLGALRAARSRARRLRRIPDRELRSLQIRGSARARRFVNRRLKADETVMLLSTTGRAVVERAQTSIRQPMFAALALVAIVFAVGSRSLYFDGIPQIGQFADWPNLTEVFAAFGSGWRETFLGSPTPAPPAFALVGVASLPLFGATGLAGTLLVLGCVPLGVGGVIRLVRSVTMEPVSAVAAGIAYAVLPVWRNAIANGRLGPLLFIALAPFLLHMLLHAAGARVDGGIDASRWRQRVVALAVLGAVVTACYPPALLLAVGVAAALAIAAPLVGGLALAGRVLTAAGVAAVGAFVLLFPWPLATLLGGAEAGSIGFGFRGTLDYDEVLRMSSGPAGARWSAAGVLAGAVLVLLIGRGARLVWGIRSWALALVGFALAWAPARFAPDLPVPAPEAALTVFALGIAGGIGFGTAAFIEDLRGHHFGWRQAVSVGALVAVALSAFGFVGDAVTGRWHAPDRDWPTALAFARATEEGSSRVLWTGNPIVLPFDAATTGEGIGYVLTVDGAGDATDLLRAPVTSADRVVAEALELAADRRTDRLGHLLAPAGVRYVIVPERVGPRAGARASAPPELVDGLDRQIDLAKVVQTQDEFRVYENTAWFPMASVIEGEAPSDDDAIGASERAEFAGARPLDGDVGPGTVLWSQAANSGWRATADGGDLTRVEPFGWVNGFALDEPGAVDISWSRQWQRNATVVVQLVIVATLIGWAWRRRLRDRAALRRGGDR